MSRKKTRTFHLTWIILSITSAFILGFFFNPGNPGGRRKLPPRLTNEQMMRRMPSRQVAVPRQMQRAPIPSNQAPARRTR